HALDERRIAGGVDDAAEEDRVAGGHARVDGVVVLRLEAEHRRDAVVVLHVLARGEGRVRGPGDGAVGAHELPRQGRGGDGVQAEVEAARGNGRGSGDRGDVARAGGFTGPDRGDVLSELSLGRGVEGAR